MSHRHLLLALPFLALCSLSSPATAASLDVKTVQTQLQAEWNDFLTRMKGAVTGAGDIQVTQAGSAYHAVLPPLIVKLQVDNTVKLNGITLDATPASSGTLNLKITLPATIPQYYTTMETGTLKIGQQNMNVTVKPAGDSWQVQTVDATLGNLLWHQGDRVMSNPLAPVEATIGQLVLNGKPSQMQLTAGPVKTKNVAGDTQTLAQLAITQQPKTAQALRLSDLLVLLTGTVPELQSGHGGISAWLQGASAMTVHMSQLQNVKADGKQSVSINDIVLQNSLAGITNNKMTLRTTGTVKGIAINIPSAFASTLPETLDFAGTLRNLPVSYMAMPFDTVQAKQAAHSALTAAGAQLQIDSLNVTTKSGLQATGTGLLTATNSAPTYATGLITLNITNLQATLSHLQQQMGQPGVANSGQMMMAMMLLQGMGKASGTQTQYIVNLAPDGKILLNDQDLSGLMGLAGLGQAKKGNTNQASPARALPVAPVNTNETLMTPAPALKR